MGLVRNLYGYFLELRNEVQALEFPVSPIKSRCLEKLSNKQINQNIPKPYVPPQYREIQVKIFNVPSLGESGLKPFPAPNLTSTVMFKVFKLGSLGKSDHCRD